MDAKRFDDAAKTIAATRRGALGALAGGLGLLIAAPDWTDARKRKRRKKKKKGGFVCTPDGQVCPPTTQRDCCNLQCCLGIGEPEGGTRYCTSWLNTCCSAEQGGGACPYEYPVCCPDGTCGRTGEECLLGVNERTGRADRVGRLR